MKVLAISGGVDSVVLLDIVAHDSPDALVAHFDHGIRRDSADDEQFVAGLATRYGLPYVSAHESLGEKASEQVARDRRYKFLYDVAKAEHAEIVTAHHADDAVGSIVINLMRGTGWRGLAVMNRPGITRPLLRRRKRDIYDYARDHRLEWVEDSTNIDAKFLRNRIKGQVARLSDGTVAQLLDLRDHQCVLAAEIDAELKRLTTQFGDDRHPYIHVDHSIALELLRERVRQASGSMPTYLDAERLLIALKTYTPGTTLQLADGVSIRFTSRKFIVVTTEK